MRSLPSGWHFDQICFVVDDLDDAIEFWKRTNGIEAWDKAIDLAKEQTEKEYWGEPGNFQFSCAYGFAGDTLIELARHDGGESVYKDWLDERGPGPHHVGVRLTDAAQYSRAHADYSSDGLKVAMAGVFEGPFGNCYEAPEELRSRYPSRPQRYSPRGAGARRIDHVTLGVRDASQMREFYVSNFRFRHMESFGVGPMKELAAFLSTNASSHDLGMIKDPTGARGRLNHVAFWLDSETELGPRGGHPDRATRRSSPGSRAPRPRRELLPLHPPARRQLRRAVHRPGLFQLHARLGARVLESTHVCQLVLRPPASGGLPAHRFAAGRHRAR